MTTTYRIDDPSGRQCDGQTYDTLEEAQAAAEHEPGSYLAGPYDVCDDCETVQDCWYVYPDEDAAVSDPDGSDTHSLPRIVEVTQ